MRLNLKFLILTKIQSDSIRMDSNEVLDPNESEVRIIQTEFWIRMIPISDSLGLKKWSGFIRVQTLWLSRIDPVWRKKALVSIGSSTFFANFQYFFTKKVLDPILTNTLFSYGIFYRFASNKIENFFRIGSDTNFGINLISSK